MRYGKATLLLCAALIVVSTAIIPAAAQSQAECDALYTCSSVADPYKSLIVNSGTCMCCSSTADSGVNSQNCVNALRICSQSHCTACASSTCTACYAGYQLVNGACELCNVVNCEECMTSSTGILSVCRVCRDEYHWNAGVCDANTASASNSHSGSSDSGSGHGGVTQCRAAYCKTCSSTSATVCSTCMDGYALDSSNNCVSTCSVAHCDLCYSSNSADCELCSSGYVWDNTQCVEQTSGCRVGHCTTCVGEASSASAALDESTCATCETDYTLTNGYCLPKNDCTVANCAACPYSPSQCTACNAGYGLVDNTCTACADPHCNYCDSNVSQCTVCANGYYLTSYGTCSPVPCSLAYCLRCNSTNPTRCAECLSPRIVDAYNGKCILSGDCNVANCLTCSATSAYLCQTCNDGYSLSTDQMTCSLTTTSTTTTSTTTTTTTTSTTGSPSSAPTPTPTATSLCNVPNCVTCVTGDSSTCQYCNPGYYTSNGQCVLTGSCYAGNCAQCMLRDSSKCSTCRNGYLLSSTYTCLSQNVVSAAAAPHSLWLAAAVLLASALTYLA